MKNISVFVDESGDFGFSKKSSAYYVITMVFHNQSFDISEKINRLNEELFKINFNNPVIHTEPLIMRRDEYFNLSVKERRAIFQKLYHFTIRCNLKYKQFYFSKKECKDELELKAKIAKHISLFLRDRFIEMCEYDTVILYYDNGQKEVNNILNAVFATELSNHETRLAYQKEYRLSQVADMICTLKLLEERANSNSLTKSELLLFGSRRQLVKDFVKPIKKLEWK